MGMRTHELHPALVHAPLVLLPTAACFDLTAALRGQTYEGGVGRSLWWAGAAGGLFAGITGLAASQQAEAKDQRAADMMWIHGLGNFTILLASIGMASYRTTRGPSVGQAVLGLGACALSLYTAYLGGEMVYGHGVGVRAAPGGQETTRKSPKVLSAKAPPSLLRDAWSGFRWLIDRTFRAKQQPPSREAVLGLDDSDQPQA